MPAWPGGGVPFPGGRFLIFSRGRRGKELSGVSFLRALILSTKAPPSGPSHLSKAPPPKSMMPGVAVFHSLSHV